MTELSPEAVEAPPKLSPAEEADAEHLLAGLAPRADQYAGLTPLEAAAAAVNGHMSMCIRPSRLECVDCSDELHMIRAYIAAVEPVIEEPLRAELAELAQADAIASATRQMANDANARLRTQLLAALERTDDGRTPLSAYISHLTAQRDALKAALVKADVINMGYMSLPAEIQAEAERAASEGQERSEETAHG